MKLHLAICVPSHDLVPATFAYDLARLVGYTVEQFADGAQLSLLMNYGTYIHTSREQLAQNALDVGATHVLWIDSDMRFPKDAAVRLLERKHPVVGINYSTRGVPPKFVAIKKRAIEPGEVAVRCPTLESSTGLEEVEAMGFGLLLMEAKVLRSLSNDLPRFGFKWLEKKKQWMGEDVFFFTKIRDKGFRSFVDHDLSKECAHTGFMEFMPIHAQDSGELTA